MNLFTEFTNTIPPYKKNAEQVQVECYLTIYPLSYDIIFSLAIAVISQEKRQNISNREEKKSVSYYDP